MSEAAYEQAEPVSADQPASPPEGSVPVPDSAATTPEAAPQQPVTLPKSLNPRPAPQRTTSRRPGLTGRGVCVLIAVATFVSGLFDMAISGHRGHLFGVLFAIASAAGALAVRKKDLRIAMVAPPLLYCALIFVMSLIDQGDLTGGLLTREAFYLGNAFVTGAPAIWAGSLLAVAIGWYRLRDAGRR